MSKPILRVVSSLESELVSKKPSDAATDRAAIEIVEDVRERGEVALRAHAERLGDLEVGAPLVLDRAALESVRVSLPAHQRELLERTAARIATFAQAQRDALTDMTIEIPGGRAGHKATPISAAGCYAPGGRFPLPSSVLMTAVTARTAGVPEVWVASPRPAPATFAAAAIAGVDGFLAVGGAQAIAALAFGTVTPRVDLIAGPGNRWVTAAKRYLFGEVGIDLLA
ncbi:MAG: phosphoribosyl-ATP pyrophosphohydrolase/phosphoribosyl-AMP cyclohydrolase/histidinol dehydrogenase, partial [Planctomycetota bacterium]